MSTQFEYFAKGNFGKDIEEAATKLSETNSNLELHVRRDIPEQTKQSILLNLLLEFC